MKRTVILDVANIMHTAANEDPFVQFENYQQNKEYVFFFKYLSLILIVQHVFFSSFNVFKCSSYGCAINTAIKFLIDFGNHVWESKVSIV